MCRHQCPGEGRSRGTRLWGGVRCGACPTEPPMSPSPGNSQARFRPSRRRVKSAADVWGATNRASASVRETPEHESKPAFNVYFRGRRASSQFCVGIDFAWFESSLAQSGTGNHRNELTRG